MSTHRKDFYIRKLRLPHVNPYITYLKHEEILKNPRGARGDWEVPSEEVIPRILLRKVQPEDALRGEM